MFKQRDIVICNYWDKYEVNLTLNNRYKVKYFKYCGDELYILIKDDSSYHNYYPAKYFILDELELRKKKINKIKEKICLKQITI